MTVQSQDTSYFGSFCFSRLIAQPTSSVLINVIDDPRHDAAVTTFRNRRDELGHVPDGTSDYVNAGYADEAAP